MKKILLVLLVLTSCTTAKIAEPVIVKVPVAIPCDAEMVPEPDWNLPKLAKNADAVTKLKAALSDYETGRGYSEELKAELAACNAFF